MTASHCEIMRVVMVGTVYVLGGSHTSTHQIWPGPRAPITSKMLLNLTGPVIDISADGVRVITGVSGHRVLTQ